MHFHAIALPIAMRYSLNPAESRSIGTFSGVEAILAASPIRLPLKTDIAIAHNNSQNPVNAIAPRQRDGQRARFRIAP